MRKLMMVTLLFCEVKYTFNDLLNAKWLNGMNLLHGMKNEMSSKNLYQWGFLSEGCCVLLYFY